MLRTIRQPAETPGEAAVRDSLTVINRAIAGEFTPDRAAEEIRAILTALSRSSCPECRGCGFTLFPPGRCTICGGSGVIKA